MSNSGFSSDKILGVLTDIPVKYFGHGKKYPKAIYKDGKIIFIESKKEKHESGTRNKK